MNFFPINLNIRNKLCVIIGGGAVGERKAFDLLDFDAKIRIVSLNFTDKILKHRDKFEIIEASYHKKYIEDAVLVFACTDSKELNMQIYKDAKKIGALVNVVNLPDFCDFTVPAVIKRGKIKIAISTDGVSPALSRILKEKISSIIGDEYKILADIMGKIREKQLKLNYDSKENREKFYRFLNEDILSILKDPDYRKKVNEITKKIFGFEIF